MIVSRLKSLRTRLERLVNNPIIRRQMRRLHLERPAYLAGLIAVTSVCGIGFAVLANRGNLFVILFLFSIMATLGNIAFCMVTGSAVTKAVLDDPDYEILCITPISDEKLVQGLFGLGALRVRYQLAIQIGLTPAFIYGLIFFQLMSDSSHWWTLDDFSKIITSIPLLDFLGSVLSLTLITIIFGWGLNFLGMMVGVFSMLLNRNLSYFVNLAVFLVGIPLILTLLVIIASAASALKSDTLNLTIELAFLPLPILAGIGLMRLIQPCARRTFFWERLWNNYQQRSSRDQTDHLQTTPNF